MRKMCLVLQMAGWIIVYFSIWFVSKNMIDTYLIEICVVLGWFWAFKNVFDFFLIKSDERLLFIFIYHKS